ncbi:MAG: cell division protein FtsB [Gammaproteobacteria bacterium]|nr:MAG: cell division protein FtsB [Gammaproteobacteria bacterium]
MRALIAVLLVMFLVLQFKLWFGDGGLIEVRELRRAITAQQEENAHLRERNAALEAEVTDLRQGLAAIEERARSELGMVIQGETFFQLVEDPPPPAPGREKAQ